MHIIAATFVVGWAAVATLPVGRKAPGPGEEQAPLGTPNVHCTSTKGDFTIEMHPEWAPIGAERFLSIVADGGLDGTVIYRVVRDQAVQFGFIKDLAVREKYRHMPNLKDDPQVFQNPNFHRGMISFAGAGPNTRGTDVFITFMTGNANGTPRAPWETPVGIINEEGMRAVTSFNPEYGDFESFGGHAPQLGLGYDAFKKTHPNLDYLGKCTLVHPTTQPPPTATIPAEPIINAHSVAEMNVKGMAPKRRSRDDMALVDQHESEHESVDVKTDDARSVIGSSLSFSILIAVLLLLRKLLGRRRRFL